MTNPVIGSLCRFHAVRKQCTFLEPPILHNQIWFSQEMRERIVMPMKKIVSSLLLYRISGALQPNVQNAIQS